MHHVPWDRCGTWALRLDDNLRLLFPPHVVSAPALSAPSGPTVSTAQNPWPPIGQLFFERGRVTSAELESALAEQRRTGERLGEILVKRGRISRIELAGALSTQWS